MKASRESSIAAAVIRAINRLPGCRAIKLSTMGRAGTPDVGGCARGRAIFLEVKRPGGPGATPIQLHELAAWARAGAITGVVRSPAEALDLIFRSGSIKDPSGVFSPAPDGDII